MIDILNDYPRVLIVSLGRLNSSDTTANGLYLRNLFGSWPRERMAQIFIAGDNGDEGFCGGYYKFGSQERLFGSLFSKLKGNVNVGDETDSDTNDTIDTTKQGMLQLKRFAVRTFKDTGIYELIFRPRISDEMERWVKDFKPDFIFAQGHTLTYIWLPLMLKETTGAKLAVITSDDWPRSLYSRYMGEPIWCRWLMRRVVKSSAKRLFSEAEVPFTSNLLMNEAYEVRYGKKFYTLNHASAPERFVNFETKRIHPPETKTVIMIGHYNRNRWPLLMDVNEACKLLNDQGIRTRIVVISSAIDPEGIKAISAAQYIDLMPDPGDDLLPSYLKGADLLLLVDGFEEDYVSMINFALSIKAHLFMFSHRPIIVYAHKDTATVNYAQMYGWGRVVCNRSKEELMLAMREVFNDKNYSAQLVSRANEIANKFHTISVNQNILLKELNSAMAARERPYN